MNKLLTTFLLLSAFVFAQDDLTWLKESPKRLNWHDAMQYCKDKGAHLPSKNTMTKMWEKHGRIADIDGFDLSVSYWTSTEVKDNKAAAYPFYFGDGKDGWYYKKDRYGVRCVK